MSGEEEKLVADQDGVRAAPGKIASRPQSILVPNRQFKNYAADLDAYGSIKRISASELYAKAAIPRTVLVEGKKVHTQPSGRMVLLERDAVGNLHRKVRLFEGWGGLANLRRTESYRRSRLVEGDAFGYGSDDSMGGRAPNDEYHPLMLGPFHRQMYLTDMLDMMSKCFEQSNHHPLAMAAVRIIKNFTVGTGVRMAFANPRCQEVWDEFDERVEVNSILHKINRELTVLGEVFVYKDFEGGNPFIRLYDASTVWEIVTNPARIEEVFYYYRQFPTQWQMFTKGGIPSARYIIEEIPPEKMWHLSVNNSVGEKRGRSDLLPALTYLKRYKDILNALTVRAQIEASFVWKKKVQGTVDDIARLAQDPTQNAAPVPGSNLWENERVDTTPLPSGIAGSGASAGYMQILDGLASLVATSMNLPPEYFGVGTQGTRANALVKSDPSMKFFVTRQELMRQFLLQLKDWVIADAQTKGLLPKVQPRIHTDRKLGEALRSGDAKAARKEVEGLRMGRAGTEPLDTECEVIFPDLVEEDRTAFIRDLQVGEEMRWISHQKASEMFADRMTIRGFDYEDEQNKIREEVDTGVTPPSVRVTPPEEPMPAKDGEGKDVELKKDKDSGPGKMAYMKRNKEVPEG